MKTIAQNEYYELEYDNEKNWLHWTMKGFWSSMSVVPDFDKDWDTAVDIAQPGFRIFADLSNLKTLPDEVQQAQDARQVKLMEAGCKKVACLVDSVLTKTSVNAVLEQNAMQSIVQYFTGDENASAAQWLSEG